MQDEFEQFRPKSPRTTRPAAAVVPDLSLDQRRAVAIARLVWQHEYTTLRTRLEEQDAEPCELCEQTIPEGDAYLILDGDRSVGYADGMCRDLAEYSGVTRAEIVARGNRPSHLGRVADIPGSAVIYLAERIAIARDRKAQR